MSVYETRPENRSDAQSGPRARYQPLGRDAMHSIHFVWSAQTELVHAVSADGETHKVTHVPDGHVTAFVAGELPALCEEFVCEYGPITGLMDGDSA